jgi:peptidase U32-like protein
MGSDDRSIRDRLEAMGLPRSDLHELPTSAKRFPDGASYRVEIPSTEGPAALDAVLDEAAKLDVRVHRVSQGSGVLMLTDAELDAMAARATEARVEVSLFARPTASWDTGAMAVAPAGGVAAPAVRGQDQLVAVLADCVRAAEHGIRSVLLTDPGALRVFDRMRSDGDLPADMQAKISVMLPAANPASARLLEDLGANTLNLPTDLTLAQIAAIRAAVDIPLDIYVEAPQNMGGFVRLHEVPDMIRVAAPMYVKLGLRNAPDVYPSGAFLEAGLLAMSRERVRRARLAMELLRRSGLDATTSELAAAGLAVPVKAGTASR